MRKTLPRRSRTTFFFILFIIIFLFVSKYKWLTRSNFASIPPNYLSVTKNEETEEEFMARMEKRMKDRRENVKNTCRSLSMFYSSYVQTYKLQIKYERNFPKTSFQSDKFSTGKLVIIVW